MATIPTPSTTPSPSTKLVPAIAAVLLLAAQAPAATMAETLRVAAGESIAAALEKAKPGTTIEVEPGIYHEALTVDLPGITLRGIVRGAERPVLEGRGELNDGVIASGSPFAISGFAIRNYKGNGVSTQGVDGARFTDLQIANAGLYGIYPVQSKNITVIGNTVTGIKDAGIYVGESETALVAGNEVFGNVAGIEIENTNDAEVRDNLAYENTAGILVFVLPGKVLKEARRNRVHRNWVVRNNTKNFGDPEAIIGNLPPGLGIFVMGADETTVDNNWVKGNNSMGIALIQLRPQYAAQDPEQEPIAEGNRIFNNVLFANGAKPAPQVVEDFGGGGDFAWDGSGEGNCVTLAESRTRRGEWLRPCNQTESAAPVAALAKPAAPAKPAAKRVATTAPNAAARAAALGQAAQVVRIRAMRYLPKHVSIRAGESVAWVNEDAVAHTITSGRGAVPTHAPLRSPFLAKGAHWVHNFAEPGAYEYLCLPHLDQAPMRGATVTVTAREA